MNRTFFLRVLLLAWCLPSGVGAANSTSGIDLSHSQADQGRSGQVVGVSRYPMPAPATLEQLWTRSRAVLLIRVQSEQTRSGPSDLTLLEQTVEVIEVLKADSRAV